LKLKSILKQSELYLHKTFCSHHISAVIDDFIKQRLRNIPFQYIINQSNFFGRDFIVDSRALIPRIETESLFYELKKQQQFYNALEVGVGSGVICCTLSLEKIAHNIVGTDISSEAINLTNENIKNFSINNISIKKHDFLNETIKQKFNLIISNPPYISMQDYNSLPPHIKNFEPKLALTDGSDGLKFYYRFADVLKNILHENGQFYCEIGQLDTLETINNIFLNQGYNVSFIKDLNKDIRFLRINY